MAKYNVTLDPEVHAVLSRSLISVVERSKNKKLGRVSATYAAQQSCPSTCSLAGAGCYAEKGALGVFHTKRLNKNATSYQSTPLDIAIEEAAGIDLLSGKLDLRLHVVGDCVDDQCASIVAAAAQRFRTRGERRFGRRPAVWTYTHSWRVVNRESWGEVSVVASCDSFEDIPLAVSRGYPTALVYHPGEAVDIGFKAIQEGRTTTYLPCPEQHHPKSPTCQQCRLCLDGKGLRDRNQTILFRMH